MFTGIQAKLLGIVGAVAGFVALLASAYFKGRKAKSREINAETTETVLETVKENKEIEEHLDSVSVDDQREWMRRED